ncbi:MAG TPA: hypothetical protein VHR66_07770 [Gemmataceae bacterium]|jgi:tetratricopeptide (TPR) repeat protein|nr:hypothetical protein [Gemmataceae bacterium]
MRYLLAPFCILFVVASTNAAPLEGASKSGYQLRVVIRTGDHSTLTRHFRAEVLKGVTSALQAALGPTGAVEGVDLNSTPPENRDPLWTLVDEKGLEALDNVTAAVGPKTHFVFIDFADNKYEIRTRQHDGSTGYCSPFVRKQVHGDRSFVARLAGLAVAQDFGVVGTFDPIGPQVSVVLKAGELGPLNGFIKKGDVFAVIQVREGRRAVAPKKAKAKSNEKEAPPPAPQPMTGTRIDGVLLHVIDEPRNGMCVCKMYNRFKGLPQRDGFTLGYRCVKLGTGEGPLKLQLTDAAGATYRGDTLQPRAGVSDYPDPTMPRQREDMRYADGVFTSTEPFKNIAFVLVRNGEIPVARLPVEIYPDQIAVRKVKLDPTTEPSPVQAAAADLFDRCLSARVIQARCFEEIATLEKKEKPRALEYGQNAADSLEKEADVLRTDMEKALERYKADSPAALFDRCEGEIRTLEKKTKEFRTHLVKLKDVIRIENDPAAAAVRKKIDGILLEADAAMKKFDFDVAIAKYEEALTLADSDLAKMEITRGLNELKAQWEIKDAEHAAARKFVYETWAKLEKPSDLRDALPEARRAMNKLKTVGDRITLHKMHLLAPEVGQRYLDALKAMIDAAVEDEDKQALAAYQKVSRDLESLIGDLTKELGLADKK